MKKILLDSSAVIALSSAGVIEKVTERFEVFVAGGVYEEVYRRGFCRVGSHELQKLVENKKVQVVSAQDREKVKLLVDPLGTGEAETIVLALENSIPAVLDDRTARRKAYELGIEFFGTLKVLRFLYDAGDLSKEELVKAIKSLREVGFRISESLISKVLETL